MFEGLQAIGAAAGAIAHVAEWSGLSVGALAACGAVIYFVPFARKFAIAAAAAVLIAWACLTHGHSVGVADEDAKLKTISDQADARAADRARTDETALVSAIEAKAKAQHDQDAAEINHLRSLGVAAVCAFNPDDPGGVFGAAQKDGAGTVNGDANLAAGAKAPHEGAPGASSGRHVPLSVVWRGWLQGKGHQGDAPPHGQ